MNATRPYSRTDVVTIRQAAERLPRPRGVRVDDHIDWLRARVPIFRRDIRGSLVEMVLWGRVVDAIEAAAGVSGERRGLQALPREAV